MQVTVLRTLELESPLIEGLPSHLSAASGLTHAGGWLHVVADDSLHLATFALEGAQPGRAQRIFPDPDLPADEKARKRLKPDLESLTLTPWREGKALLALGSGSTANRRRGILQPLYDCGEAQGGAIVFDAGPLYDALGFQELNLEGAAVVGDRLFLGQRGNSAEGRNALIELELEAALRAIAEGQPWTGDLVLGVTPLDLGRLQDVALTLTDLSAFGDDKLLLVAAAEDTDNPYDDGAVLGSALACYGLAGGELRSVSLDGPWKVEGVEALDDGRILLVTDGDDPSQPALLLQTRDDGLFL